MNLQLITTKEDLQIVLTNAINNAFAEVMNVPALERQAAEIIGTKELCSRLGVTEPTIIRWRKKGKIPWLQLGSSVRFNYPKVIEALESTNKRRAKAC